MTRLGGALAGRYTIERELGAGGMATVYLARDLRHERQVAIKVLRPELARALGTERFLREIKMAAALHHPHILQVYDSGEADGFVYYVMPFVAGESLRDRLRREKQLPVDDALRIGREVADALSHAHSRGLVHRDIKPENILLESGHAIVADFGIARAISEAAGTRLTETGMAIGTPSYMSPEQASGSADVDGRSDIYSLGCVVYEMLAGVPPFVGPTAESLVHQHLAVAAPSVTGVRPAVAPGIGAALAQALAKTPADRFPTAQGFADALAVGRERAVSAVAPDARPGVASRRAWRTVAVVTVLGVVVLAVAWLTLGDLVRSRRDAPAVAMVDGAAPGTAIAVLPFSVKGSPDLGYLREGMVSLLSTTLDGAGELRTVDAGTLLRFVDREEVAPSDPAGAVRVAEAFGAGYFVMGSLVEAGGRIQVTATLYDRRGELHEVGQGAVQGAVEQLFELVDDLTSQLLSRLSGGPASRVRRIAAVTTPSLPALKAFLEGEDLFRRAQFGAAVEAFQRAVAADSLFALAYYRLSLTAEWNLQDNLAREAAEQAVRYDRRLAYRDRRLLEAFLVRRRGANAEAERLYRSILGTHPDEMEAWLDLAEVLFHANPLRGRSFTEARDALERVLDFDPRHSTALIHLSRLVAFEGKVGELDTLVERFLALNPDAGRRLELDALRAFARGDQREIEATMGRLERAGDLGVALAVWAAGVYSSDLRGAQRVAELLTAPHRAPEARRLGYAWLAHLDLAFGRWRAAQARLDALAGLSDGAALEYRALLARTPFAPASDSALARIAAELQRLDPRSVATSDNPSIVFTAHDPLHPLIRSYLLALLYGRLGDAPAARRHATTLARVALPATAGSLAEDLARSARAQLLVREGRAAQALAELEGARMETWYGQTMASPLYSQVFERFMRAELLRELGRLEEASQWYANLVQTSPFELPYLALSHLRRAEIADTLGQRERAVSHYAAFAALWQDADPELQPLVDGARRRLEALRVN